MTVPKKMTVDGNEAAASVAYRINEVAAIYPITPSSTMGELADEWSARGDVNIWGRPLTVVEMQSEAGAAGAVHGVLQAGALATTFTSSQGLLLMIPNMYKIAGELTSYCMHVAARTIATHALSIFGDHSDVMACRQIGFGLMSSCSVQEAHDFALIAQVASFRSRIPFLHFFDGFRTSHEVSKIDVLSDDDLRALFPEDLVQQHRARALTPDRPVLRGSAQNPDAFFQAREASNPFYEACPSSVAETMAEFAKRTGRKYGLFDYFGHPEAERVLVLMGSGVETVRETVDYLVARGEKVGVVAVRLYRPFSVEHFIGTLPKSVTSMAVLDRTKEPGAIGDPLYLDVIAALREAEDLEKLPFHMPRVIAGRYGLSSKEFSPAMVKAIFDELEAKKPRRRFTVGIVDDVTHRSLEYDPEFDIEADDVVRAVFFGLGADGTVGANKNSIKIIGEETDFYVQGYFVYDSKKSGAVTISHLRFGPRPIRSTYLIRNAGFVACHQFNFLERMNVLDCARPGAVFLLNSPHGAAEVWDKLPRAAQEQIIEKKIEMYVIDGSSVAIQTGMGGRVNTIMQTCFFALSGVLPRAEAIAQIKKSIEKSYARKGDEIVRRNWAAVDLTLENLHKVEVPSESTAKGAPRPVVPAEAPDFVQRITAVMMAGKGDLLPVSAFAPDGTWPTGTAQWERRNIALEIPIFDPEFCIQCNKCALVCPHAAIRAKVYDKGALAGAPATFKFMDYKGADYKGMAYTIQVAPEDCTGCNLCVNVCPGKDKTNPKHKAINMMPESEHAAEERPNFAFFLDLPELDRTAVARFDVKGTQFLQPLFEFSGACAGCGETPYIKLLTQLYGDRLLIANATGCTSIYGGNLPTTPYSQNSDGRGPAWSNSLFEDNAEFGLGFRLAIDTQIGQAKSLLTSLASELSEALVHDLLTADQTTEKGIAEQRSRVASLRELLKSIGSPEARRLEPLADYLVRKSVWLIGGDGWAFDIGYGGLDHVLSLDYDVNVLVLDTEVYSNTGGQASKATPLGAAAKFASHGKNTDKKDLGLMAMNYGHVYVASIAFGARDAQTVRALMEADAYPGPSLVIAYSHCIAHGYDMAFGLDQQKRAVDSGVWPVYRFDPRRIDAGEPPLVVDMPGGKIPVQDYMRNEARFRMVEKMDPERFRDFARRSQLAAERRIATYQHLATMRLPKPHEVAIATASAPIAPATATEE